MTISIFLNIVFVKETSTKIQGIQNSQNNSVTEQSRRTHTLHCQNVLQNYSNGYQWCWSKDGHVGQQTRTERTKMNSHILANWFSMGGGWTRKFNGGKDILSNKCCWDSYIANIEQSWTIFHTAYTNINSKWITDLNVTLNTIKLSEGNTGPGPALWQSG